MSDSKRERGRELAAEMGCETYPSCDCLVVEVCAERVADREAHVLRKP